MKRIIVVTIALLILTASVWPQNLIPEMKLGDASLKIWGYNQFTFVENADPEYDWLYCRILETVKVDDRQLCMEQNFAHMDRQEINWLRKFYLECGLGENWKIRFGRLPVAGFYSAIAPFKLETVVYPLTESFRAYAYGVQLVGEFGDGWCLMADVTGSSGFSFDSSRSFQYPEGSARITKKFNNDFSLSGSLQLSEEYQNFGIDGTWKVSDKSYFRAAVYRSENEISDSFGGYILGAYRPQKLLELHSRLDLGEKEGRDLDLVLTNGLRIFGLKDRLSFTADIETPLAGDRDCRFLARLQIVF
jgi:hypothetical protein